MGERAHAGFGRRSSLSSSVLSGYGVSSSDLFDWYVPEFVSVRLW